MAEMTEKRVCPADHLREREKTSVNPTSHQLVLWKFLWRSWSLSGKRQFSEDCSTLTHWLWGCQRLCHGSDEVAQPGLSESYKTDYYWQNLFLQNTHQFPRPDIIEHQKWHTEMREMYRLRVLEAGSVRSQCGQGHALFGTCQELSLYFPSS